MKKILLFLLLFPLIGLTQEFKIIKQIPTTPVKNQHYTNTCWSYATVSFLETEAMRITGKEVQLSVFYPVYYTYLQKAQMYIWLYGDTRFGPGGLGHDVMYVVKNYGIVPEDAYPTRINDDSQLLKELHSYLDSILKYKVVPDNWQKNFEKILKKYLGKPPKTIKYEGRTYKPKAFAYNVLKLDPNNYVEFTSFPHHNLYEQCVLEIPDNWMHAEYWNVPLIDLVDITVQSLEKGYSVVWDADVTEEGFNPRTGIAELTKKQQKLARKKGFTYYREMTFNNHTTSDDHLMHITGLAEKDGKKYFIVKNSWGEIGPYKGYIYVSEDYFKAKTISVLVHKDVIPEDVKEKIYPESHKDEDEED